MTTEEVAPRVYRLALGRGYLAVNAYLVNEGSCWALVDSGWQGDEEAIGRAVAEVASAQAPAAILLTHAHPDHSGAARGLARRWGCRVWVHARELPLALGDTRALWEGTGPLDRWAILPAMRALGRRRMEAALARENLAGVVETLDPGEEPPGLPGWRVLQTPGHTPGHMALLRAEDGVVITGDAVSTVELNRLPGVLLQKRRICGPPWIATWHWTMATASARAVLALEPRVLAGGHGAPMAGRELEEASAAYLRRA